MSDRPLPEESHVCFCAICSDKVIGLEAELKQKDERIAELESEVCGLVSHRYQLDDARAKAESRLQRAVEVLEQYASATLFTNQTDAAAFAKHVLEEIQGEGK